jgi:glycosyltransferase involved in cell wall biosynthesis
MRVLVAANRVSPCGGAESVFLNTVALLAKHGHKVVPFSGADAGALWPAYAKYYPVFPSVDDLPVLKRALTSVRHFLYSFEAARRLEQLLATAPVDVAHLHNVYTRMTGSIVRVLRARSIPVVMTVHDWKLVCPSRLLYVDGAICERCSGGRFWNASLRRCFHSSRAASVFAMLEGYWERWLGFFSKGVDVFVFPSEFARAQFLAMGFRPKRTAVIRNFVPKEMFAGSLRQPGDYALYFGRLSEEKGVSVLLEALSLVPEIKLVIAGDGPLKPHLEELAGRRKLDVKFVGWLGKGELRAVVEGCRFVVVPSLCHEIAPMAVCEAMAAGKPVIASKTGGIPELVESGVNGYVVEPHDPVQLAETMKRLWLASRTVLLQMGRNGLSRVREEHSEEKHYSELVSLYSQLLAERGPGSC